MFDISDRLFHLGVGVCLTAIAMFALYLEENTIAGTALGALGGYVLKNGALKKE